MQIKKYKRDDSVKYAKKWAYLRNPKYYNYDAIGGDCTNFVSQCIYEGCKVMNYDKVNGWYYKKANDKSPSWTGVEFLYKFLINNKVIISKGGVEWLCKNVFKQKYLDLLVKYKMELAEKYIKDGYIYDEFFGRN